MLRDSKILKRKTFFPSLANILVLGLPTPRTIDTCCSKLLNLMGISYSISRKHPSVFLKSKLAVWIRKYKRILMPSH